MSSFPIKSKKSQNSCSNVEDENVFNVAPKAMASTSSTSGNVLGAQYPSKVSLPTWNIQRGQKTEAFEPCGIPGVIANSSQSSNEQWHGQRNQELRIQAVQMREEIQVDQGPKFNQPPGITIEERTMCNLKTYVRKIMDDARKVPSEYEYRQSLIKKLCVIHKEIERKKLKRDSGVLLRDSFNLCSHLMKIHKAPPFGNEVRFQPISINLTEMFEGDNLFIRIPANTSLQNQKFSECTRRRLELLQGIAPKYSLKDHIIRDQIMDNNTIEIYAKMIVRREMHEIAKSESEFLHLLCVEYYIFKTDVYKRMWKKEDELRLLNANVPLLKIVENRLYNAQVSGASNIPLNSAVISSQTPDKELYEPFNQMLRKYMIRKIILTIRASQQIREDQDPKLNRPASIMIENGIRIINNIMQYAMNKERDFAEMAMTEYEYIRSLAKLYYNIKENFDK